MKTSAAGRAILTVREGYRLSAYRDSEGIVTIGVGHTGRMSRPPVTMGMTITAQQCDEFLITDLLPVETALNKAIKVPVTQTEFDAMASWLFNVGAGDAKSSTIIRKLNLGDIKGAAAGFDLYHKPPEIIGRRNSEKAQFLKPDAASPTVAADRAVVLSSKSTAARAQARTSTAGAVALAVGGAAVAIVAPAHTHHWGLILGLGALLLVLAGLAALVAAARASAAQTMAANGNQQAQASLAPVTSASPLAKS
jgi:lysozyme